MLCDASKNSYIDCFYVYVGGDPVSKVDPEGLDSWGSDPGMRFKVPGNVPYPSTVNPELFLYLHCVQKCNPDAITVSATTNGHTEGAHVAGQAADFTVPNGVAGAEKAACCALQCQAQYVQDEYHYPSPHSTGGHIHGQLVPGKGGATGTGRKPKPKCEKCSSSGN